MSVERFELLRGRIDETDRAIVATVNERLRLVAELWQLKRELDLPQFDTGREAALRQALAAGNTGPLSAAGLDRLVTELLTLTRDELGG